MSGLRVLLLEGNSLVDLRAVCGAIAPLRNIVYLTLRDNPLALLGGYRATVVNSVAGLCALDGMAVGDAEVLEGLPVASWRGGGTGPVPLEAHVGVWEPEGVGSVAAVARWLRAIRKAWARASPVLTTQRLARGFLARRRVARIIAARQEAVVRIGRSWRSLRVHRILLRTARTVGPLGLPSQASPLVLGVQYMRLHRMAIKIQRAVRRRKRNRLAMAPALAASSIQRAFRRFRAARDRLFKMVHDSGAQHLYFLPRFEPVVQKVLVLAQKMVNRDLVTRPVTSKDIHGNLSGSSGGGAGGEGGLAPPPRALLRYTNHLIVDAPTAWAPLSRSNPAPGLAVREVHFNRPVPELFALHRLRIGGAPPSPAPALRASITGSLGKIGGGGVGPRLAADKPAPRAPPPHAPEPLGHIRAALLPRRTTMVGRRTRDMFWRELRQHCFDLTDRLMGPTSSNFASTHPRPQEGRYYLQLYIRSPDLFGRVMLLLAKYSQERERISAVDVFAPMMDTHMARAVAAVRIQSAARAWLARRRLDPPLRVRVLRMRAAVTIQCAWRRALARARRALLEGLALIVETVDTNVLYIAAADYTGLNDPAGPWAQRSMVFPEQLLAFNITPKNVLQLVENEMLYCGLPLWPECRMPVIYPSQLESCVGRMDPYALVSVNTRLQRVAEGDLDVPIADSNLLLRVTFASVSEARNRAALLYLSTFQLATGRSVRLMTADTLAGYEVDGILDPTRAEVGRRYATPGPGDGGAAPAAAAATATATPRAAPPRPRTTFARQVALGWSVLSSKGALTTQLQEGAHGFDGDDGALPSFDVSLLRRLSRPPPSARDRLLSEPLRPAEAAAIRAGLNWAAEDVKEHLELQVGSLNLTGFAPFVDVMLPMDPVSLAEARQDTARRDRDAMRDAREALRVSKEQRAFELQRQRLLTAPAAGLTAAERDAARREYAVEMQSLGRHLVVGAKAEVARREEEREELAAQVAARKEALKERRRQIQLEREAEARRTHAEVQATRRAVGVLRRAMTEAAERDAQVRVDAVRRQHQATREVRESLEFSRRFALHQNVLSKSVLQGELSDRRDAQLAELEERSRANRAEARRRKAAREALLQQRLSESRRGALETRSATKSRLLQRVMDDVSDWVDRRDTASQLAEWERGVSREATHSPRARNLMTAGSMAGVLAEDGGAGGTGPLPPLHPSAAGFFTDPPPHPSYPRPRTSTGPPPGVPDRVAAPSRRHLHWNPEDLSEAARSSDHPQIVETVGPVDRLLSSPLSTLTLLQGELHTGSKLDPLGPVRRPAPPDHARTPRQPGGGAPDGGHRQTDFIKLNATLPRSMPSTRNKDDLGRLALRPQRPPIPK